jgi:uncharacterized protein with HEPN domain
MRRDRERILDILEALDTMIQNLQQCSEEWRKIVGLRNVLVHQYFGIDRPMVSEVATAGAPVLREHLRAIHAQEFPE